MGLNDMAEKIKRLRAKKGMTLEDVASIVGVGKSTVRKWETGIIENMRRDKILSLSEALGTTPEYLMGWEEDPKQDWPDGAIPIIRRTYNVLGNISCGEPVEPDQMQEVVVSEITPNADFILYANGDSMIGARIYDGDMVFIRKQETSDNGQIAAVSIDGETTLKRFYYDAEAQEIALYPENPSYRPLRFKGPDMAKVRVIGIAVAFQAAIK